MLSNISAYGQSASWDTDLFLLSDTFSVYVSSSRSTHTDPNHSLPSLPQDNFYRVHTKTPVPALSDSLLSRGRPFLCSPHSSNDIWLFCCLRGEVMFSWKCTVCVCVRLQLLDTSRGENRLWARTTSPRLVVNREPEIIHRGIITAVLSGMFSLAVKEFWVNSPFLFFYFGGVLTVTVWRSDFALTANKCIGCATLTNVYYQQSLILLL